LAVTDTAKEVFGNTFSGGFSGIGGSVFGFFGIVLVSALVVGLIVFFILLIVILVVGGAIITE